MAEIIAQVRPDEVYNLGAMSHVKVSFEMSEYTAEADGLGTLRILNAIRTAGLAAKTRFYQASTSELYGKVQEIPQSETTPFYPRSPYGMSVQSLVDSDGQYQVWQNNLLTGLLSIIVRHTTCMQRTAFCSTTKARAVVRCYFHKKC